MIALRRHLATQEQAILLAAELGFQEAKAGVLQVVHAQEFSTADDLLDVFSAEQQLSRIGKL